MSRRLFGTDGIRGRSGQGPLSDAGAARIGRAVAAALGGAGRAVIGRDTRPSGEGLTAALARGLASGGWQTADAGVAPTPAVSCLVQTHGYDLGIAVTASHNPPGYNGIKLFSPNGAKVPDGLQARVEALYAASVDAPAPSPPPKIAHAPLTAYVDRVVEAGGGDSALTGLRVVMDCARGAACSVAPEIARRLGLEVTWLADDPDGARINEACGALYPEVAADTAVREGAAIALSFDGDADRVLVADETGTVHDGDALMLALARQLATRGELPGGVVVATVLSNMGLEVALREQGLRLERTAVGDRHVSATLLANGWALGGEQSGHLILPALLGPTGDALGVAAVLMRCLRTSDVPASSLLGGLVRFPQHAEKVEVSRKPPIAELPGAADAIHAAGDVLGADGRVLVRYSGTEPILRLNVEHRDDAIARSVMADLRAAFERALAAADAL
jgi:phosphoglucosamine mutase